MPPARRLASSLLIALAAVAGTAATGGPSVSGDPTAEPAALATTPVVLVLLENEGNASILGSPDAPYLNASGAFACDGPSPGLMCGTFYPDFVNPQPSRVGPDGNSYGSLPGYLELTSADLSTFTPENCPGSLASTNTCFKDVHGTVDPALNPQENLFHQLEVAGLSWGAFAEGMDAPCALHNNRNPATGGSYATRHFPPVYYADIVDACAGRAVAYRLGAAPDPAALPAFSFLTPDTCSDMHDRVGCVVPTAPTDCTAKVERSLQLCIGDDWLATNLPPLLSRALVIVTFDEDGHEGGNDNRVPLFMAGVGVEGPSVIADRFTFDGLLHGLQDHWSLPCIPGDGISLYGHTPGSCGAAPVVLPAPPVTAAPTGPPSPAAEPPPSG